MHRPLSAIRQLDHHQLSTPTRWAINDRQGTSKKRVVGVNNGNVSDSPIYVYGIMKYSANRASHDATEVDRRVAQVRVIDPHHPLYGSCLPVSDRRSGRGPDLIVVRLADGRERSIQRSATDLPSRAAGSTQTAKQPMHISVRTLLPLATHIRAVLASRHEDFEDGPVSDRAPARPEHGGRGRIGSGGAAPVASASGGEAAAIGTADRSASSTSAPGARSGDGETSF